MTFDRELLWLTLADLQKRAANAQDAGERNYWNFLVNIVEEVMR